MPAFPATLSSSDAARLLGVSTTSVKRWADEGLLPCIKTAGHHRRFSRRAVEGFKSSLSSAREEQEGDRVASAPWLSALRWDAPTQGLEARLLLERAEAASWAEVADRLREAVGEMAHRWARAELTTIEEHVCMERLQRAIERACEWQPNQAQAPRALLATAEHDDQTLELSLVELALREMSWVTLFAGRRSSAVAIQECVAASKGELQLVALSASTTALDAEALAAEAEIVGAACRARHVPLLLCGPGSWPEEPRYGRRLRRVAELGAVLRAQGA